MPPSIRRVARRLSLSAVVVSVLFGAVAPIVAEPLRVGVISNIVPRAEPPGGAARSYVLEPAHVERDGALDWSGIDRLVDAGGERPIVLRVNARRPGLEAWPAPGDVGRFDRFLATLKAAVRRYGDRVDVWEIGAFPPGRTPEPIADDAAGYAYLLKQGALAVRAVLAERGLEGRIAQATVPADATEWQAALWRADVAAYIDVVPVRLEAGEAVERLAAWRADTLRRAPAPEIWAVVPAGDSPWDAPAAAVASLAAGADAVWWTIAQTDVSDTRVWADELDRLLAEGFVPAASGAARVEGGTLLGRFFDGTGFRSAVALRPRADGPTTLEIEDDARNVMLDALDGEPTLRLGSSAGERRRRVELDAGERPVLVLFERRRAGGLEIDPEQLEVAASRGLTAEEIIARHQAVDAAQRERLERWIARGRVDYHARVGPGGTATISIVNNYFWERGGELEWEQVDYLINGNRVRWKSMPELPLIQPEKVLTLPLDLTMDRTYRYRLSGRERVDGREAYVLSFQPLDADAPLSLYRGRVWIDVETFVRLKASVIQTKLDAPVLSNEEVERFAPVAGPEGESYWMFESIEGQQTWNAAGRTFVVEREISFESYEINPPASAFESRRQAAYASPNQMLRDTASGYRYLERRDDGSRVVRDEADTTQLFGAAGAFRDASSDGVRPLGGVNWFDYDFRGSGRQLNLFFAGVAGFATASDPEMFGSKVDGTANVTLLGLKFDNEVFVGEDERVEERIEVRPQNVSVRIGRPLGKFVRVSLGAALGVRDYFDDDEALRAIEAYNSANPSQSLEFRLPEDHLQLGASALVEFNRRGYTISLEGSRVARSDWAPWGMVDTAGGTTRPVVFDPALGRYVDDSAPESPRDEFTRWSLTAVKEWRLPKFQKLRAEANLMAGDDLDRFSRFQFSLFGDQRLNGFAGTGVRFEEGAIGRFSYAFNLFEAIRFSAVVESASVRERRGEARRSFSGAGVSGNVVGPWKTVISASYGRAIASDIPELEGEHEFLVLVLKLF